MLGLGSVDISSLPEGTMVKVFQKRVLDDRPEERASLPGCSEQWPAGSYSTWWLAATEAPTPECGLPVNPAQAQPPSWCHWGPNWQIPGEFQHRRGQQLSREFCGHLGQLPGGLQRSLLYHYPAYLVLS